MCIYVTSSPLSPLELMFNVDIMCGYGQAMYMQIVFLNFNKQNVMQVVWGHGQIWGAINMQERGGSKRISNRGPRGNYPCLLIQPTS